MNKEERVARNIYGSTYYQLKAMLNTSQITWEDYKHKMGEAERILDERLEEINKEGIV